MARYHTIENLGNCVNVKGIASKWCLPLVEDCEPTATDGILTQAGQTWNCNLCPTDEPYYIPYVKGDKIMLQTRAIDRFSLDKTSPDKGWGDWINAEMHFADGTKLTVLNSFASRWLAGWDGRGNYQLLEIDTSFFTGTCFKVVITAGLPEYGLGASAVVNAVISYAQGAALWVTTADAAAFTTGENVLITDGVGDTFAGVLDSIADFGGGKLLRISGVPPDTAAGYSFVQPYITIVGTGYVYETQEFALAADCDDDPALVQSTWQRYDCFGNYYGLPVASVGNKSFRFNNALRYWADMRNTSGTVNKDLFAEKVRKVTAQDIWTLTLHTTPIPPFMHKMLLQMHLGGQLTYVNGTGYRVDNFSVRNKIDYNNMLLYNVEMFTQCIIAADNC
jgi:hypothetical protein